MVENDTINQDKRYRIKNDFEKKVMSQLLDILSLRRMGNYLVVQ